MIDAGRGGEWISSGALNRFQFVIPPQRVIQVNYWRLWCWLAADRRPDLSLCHKLDSLGRNINLAAVWVFPQKFVLNSFDSFNYFFYSHQQHESWRWPSSNFRKTRVNFYKSLKKIRRKSIILVSLQWFWFSWIYYTRSLDLHINDWLFITNLNEQMIHIEITSEILSIHLSLSTKSKVLWTAKIFAKLQN